MGVELGPDEVAYRCNLVTLGADGTMVDFAAGHLSSEQSHPIIAALDAALGDGRDGVRFHAGVEYRHLVVVPGDWADAECVPPHDLTGKPAVWPTGPAAPKLEALMDASRPVVARGRGRGRLDRDADLALGPGRPSTAARLRQPLRRRRSADLGRRPRPRPRRARRHRGARRARRDGRVRQRLRRPARRLPRLARGPRLLPAARRGHRRGRPPAERGREGGGARGLGPRDHRTAARGAPGVRAVPDPAAAGPRHADSARHPHLRAGAVPALRLRGSGDGHALHRGGHGRLLRRSPRTGSWPGWSRGLRSIA